ncbi:uncharacterized protein [Watersipora subatra]|uniref:uncharacterized protein n=1 Tax=Watersipora subatra TaxID=2589382 RepID=UPI00355B429D
MNTLSYYTLTLLLSLAFCAPTDKLKLAPDTSLNPIAIEVIFDDLLSDINDNEENVAFSNEERFLVLSRLSNYIFGDDEAGLVRAILSLDEQESRDQAKRDSPLYKERHSRDSSIHSRQRRHTHQAAASKPVDRLSISQEYRVLSRISNLLRGESSMESSRQLLNDMVNLG